MCTSFCSKYSKGVDMVKKKQEEDIVHDLYRRKYRLIVIFGEILAGKAHFAKQVVATLNLHSQQQGGKPVNDVTVCCVGITAWDELMLSLGQALGLKVTHKDSAECKVMVKLKELNTNSTDVCLILIFTHFEDIGSRETLLRRFDTFIQNVLDTNTGVSVLVTSRVNTHLSNCHGFKLEPMSEHECLKLLNPVVPHCRTLEPLYLIVRRCCYRPALILRVCQILQTHHQVVTPEEVAHALRTPGGVLDVFTKYPSPEGSLSNAIKKQLERLPAPLESDTRKLCYLNGSFGVTEATKMLRKPDASDVKLTTLVPLQEHAVVNIDRLGQQIQIDPFIRAFLLDHKLHVRHNDPHKKIIVDFLGEILRRLHSDISVRTKGRALGFAQNNFHLLESTLTQAVHTSGEESYKVHLQVVKLEEGCMSALCPEMAVIFYKCMVDASCKFGSPSEQAMLQGFLAVSLTEKNGDELSDGAGMITNSLKRLPLVDNYYRLVLMGKLGWMHIRLGEYSKANEILTEARELCEQVPRERKDTVEPHRIQIFSRLAIVNQFLGNYPEAQRLIRVTIGQAKSTMPDHPVLAVLLQTLGLSTERQGHIEKALTYYRIAGNERLKLKTTLPSYLVTNLNNRASIYTWRGELEKAFPLLEEALNLRKELGWWDYNTALTLWYRGNAYLLRLQPDESVRSCEQAKEVLERCTPRHPSNVNVRLTLAHAHMVLGHRQKAREALEETFKYAEEFQENMNEISFLTSLEHLILMIELESDMENLYQRLIQEAERLSDVFKNTDRVMYSELQRKLSSWRGFLGQALCWRSKAVFRRCDSGRICIVGFPGGGHNVKSDARGDSWEGTERAGEDRHRVAARRMCGEDDLSDLQKTWSIPFTCQHCEMLGWKYDKWRQSKIVGGEEEIM